MKTALFLLTVAVGSAAQAPHSSQAPAWREKRVDLGTVWVGMPLKHDLRPAVAQSGVRFFLEGEPPKWMHLTQEGFLTGSPADRDAGVVRLRIRASNDRQFSDSRAVVTVRRVEEFHPALEGSLMMPDRQTVALPKSELPKDVPLEEFAKTISDLMKRPVSLSDPAAARDARVFIEAREDCTNHDLILAFHSALAANGLVAKSRDGRIAVEVSDNEPLEEAVTWIWNVNSRAKKHLLKTGKPSSLAWLVSHLEEAYGPLSGHPNGRLLVNYPTLVISDTPGNIREIQEFVDKKKKAQVFPSPQGLRIPRQPTGSPDPIRPNR